MSPDELPDHVRSIYRTFAREWDFDRRNSAWNDRPWLMRFADLLPDGARVLDLGCGSGEPVARYLDGRGFRLVGIDSSEGMIALCRARFPNHEWIVGDMRTTALDRRFDGILGWDSFFFLRRHEQRAMFDLFGSHAGSGGLLMFNTGPRAGEFVGEYQGQPLYHASLDAEEYEALLSKAVFDVLAHSVEDWETGGGRTIWLSRAL